MSPIIRNVRDIGSREREALEHVLGRPLADNERVVIQVEMLPPTEMTGLPPWCDVYAGLSDQEIAEVEKIALSRSELARPSE